jgi:hypothetical protein
MQAIAAALRPVGIKHIASYEPRTDTIVLEVDKAEEVERVRTLLPASLRDFVAVQQGAVPVPFQVSGAQPGDNIYGGWWYYKNDTITTHDCSFAFTDRYLNKDVILTAAHCGPSYYVQETGHMVRLADQPLAKGAAGFDYAIHDITNLGTSPHVWYDNNSITHPQSYSTGYNNTVPGYKDEGYFRLVGHVGFYSQYNGDPVCKSGRSTGFTCGIIVDDNATWNGGVGLIRWGHSDQDIAGYPGDSGGSAFQIDPNPGDVNALGIIVGGTTIKNPDGTIKRPCLKSDGNCTVVHMPIDYIFNNHAFTLNIASQR